MTHILVEGCEECASVEGSGILSEDSETDSRVEAQCVLEGVGYADISGEATDIYCLYVKGFDASVHLRRAFTALEYGILVFVKAFPFV